MKAVNFFKTNINATLLIIIIGLLSFIYRQNSKAMDTLIINTQKLKESDIKQDIMIVLNKEDIKEVKIDVTELQGKHFNYQNQYITGKK